MSCYLQAKGGTSMEGLYVDRFHHTGPGHSYLTRRNSAGAGKYLDPIDTSNLTLLCQQDPSSEFCPRKTQLLNWKKTLARSFMLLRRMLFRVAGIFTHSCYLVIGTKK